jgi:hypothetical protein
MRRAASFGMCALVIAAAMGAFPRIGRADCAAPQVSTVRSAEPGTIILVRGQYWASECNDTSSCTSGCISMSCTEAGAQSPPETGLRVTVVPADAPEGREGTILVQGLDADPETYAIRVGTFLPAELEPGRYRVTMGNDHSGIYRSQPFQVVAEGSGDA